VRDGSRYDGRPPGSRAIASGPIWRVFLGPPRAHRAAAASRQSAASNGKRQPEARGSWEDGAVVEIVTERLLLRLFQMDDLPAFVAYRREPEVARYQSWDTTYSMADAERFVASQEGVELGAPGAWVQLAAIDRLNGTLCGDCAVRVVAEQPGTAEVGVTLAPDRQGIGLATEALTAVINKLFGEHGLHRVCAQADDRNVAVHRLLERLGFRCEARLVEADWFKGEWSTLRVFAILRREWVSA
jgi:RimJ/RimL family protein N-acetyltransferase